MDNLVTFLDSKKSKPFHKFLRRWFSGREYTDLEIAINLSSLLTHSLIEIQGNSNTYYQYLMVSFQTDTLNQFLRGEIDADRTRILYFERFGRLI